ncbi:MAG: sugar kinase [Planctomycetes bacterium]|nr:sugar kinase [Planctomycetota bacterium]
MAKIVIFGEILLRLAPEGPLRFAQANCLQATHGGEEANVAVSLANFGHTVNFVSKLPKNEIGQMALGSLRRSGVETSHVTRGGDRIGLYYQERGVSQRPGRTIYDRAGSAFAGAVAKDFKWEKILDGMRWFHFSGITAALSPALAESCEAACKVAKEKGVVISCELNYRKSLWTPEQAAETMGRLCEYADLGIVSDDDAKEVFGIAPADGAHGAEAYEEVAKQLAERFKFSKTAVTLRSLPTECGRHWSAVLYDSGKFHHSRDYQMCVVDDAGSAESFTAGIIHSVLGGTAPQTTVDFAAAASCLKYGIQGEANHVSVEEVRALVKTAAAGAK